MGGVPFAFSGHAPQGGEGMRFIKMGLAAAITLLIGAAIVSRTPLAGFVGLNQKPWNSL